MQATEKPRQGTILKALVSPQMILALLALLAFWWTLNRHEDIFADEGGGSQIKRQMIMQSQEVLQRAAALPPARLLAEGKPDQAIEQAHKLAKEKALDVETNICAGNVLLATGNVEDGFHLLKRSVSLAPRSRYVRLNYAEQLARQKRYNEAIDQYKQICNAYARWPEPRLALAEIYFTLNRPAEAADALKCALEADPNNGAARQRRGIALARAGKAGPGLEEYFLGIATEQNFAGLPEDIKQMVANWGSLDRAIFQLRHDLTINPDNPVTKLHLARVLMYTGQTAQAKDLLLEARKKAPQNWEIRRNLAMAMKRLGEDNLALSEFMQSVNLERREEKRHQEDQ